MALAHIERLTSLQNPLLKLVRKAFAKGSATEDGLILAEGFHQIEEARRSQAKVEVVIGTEHALGRIGNIAPRLVELSDAFFRETAGTEAPQGILALVRLPAWQPAQLWSAEALVLVLDGIQDPGNAGTMIRTAEAFGATGVVALKGTVDLNNPKVIRASAGSIFRVPTLRSSTAEIPVPSYAAAADAKLTVRDVDWKGPAAIIIGSEGHGVSAPLRKASTGVRIPTRGVESLNAGIAAAVLLYEAAAQRGTNK
ncbi:TrmH family RNA methyltransferase [Bryobacter aggregatus]|uniref:TrmH family RNA methyltransferase n=1 Tax=Bryobacter aggregatus TaxID=360054 RepID=UPI0004E24D6C|nr:RNA methyltransferase [Bryobacter aggregatus]